MTANFLRDTLLINLLLALTLIPTISESQETVGDQYDKFLPGRESTTAKLLRSKGYIVRDHYIKVQDNLYTLNMVRVTNPMINNGRSGLPDKEPILFIHGLILNAIGFFYFSEGVSPKDYSSYNVSLMSLDELNDLLEDEPGSQSLVFTALNFGHEVWLVNRRNVRDTVEANSNYFVRANLNANTTTNNDDDDEDVDEANSSGPERRSDKLFNLFGGGGKHRYWNYSLDEQAKYDVPEAIKYVLEKSSNHGKLSIVAHSAGSALTLLALTNFPELADKSSKFLNTVNKAILWAPAMDLPYRVKHPLGIPMVELIPILSRIDGPLPPELSIELIEGLVEMSCDNGLLKKLVCEPISDVIVGLGSSQLKLEKLKPQTEWFNPIPSFELAQFLQSIERSTLHYYDYFDETRNMNAYGQLKPPKYNLTRITLETMSFWVGVTDSLVSDEDTDYTMRQIVDASPTQVPVKRYHIGGTGILWNHLGFLLHRDVSKYLIIPSLKALV